jgi:hypothetical protein
MVQTAGNHDTANLSGFAQFYLEVLEVFRQKAVDNHLATGENLEDVQAHIRGVVDEETLLEQYELPVVMTTPTPLSPDYSTISADNGTMTVQCVAWTADYDPGDLGQVIALEDAIILGGNILTNVEESRTLVNSDGEALAESITVSDFSPDFSMGNFGSYVLKFCKVDFDIRYKRRTPTG